ncbi:Forkhead-associated (FHA) domain [Dillenia turbinata]|uniref:Forkhead-associated (FHA) domain n=1 Tax=Dillenia turbinata TaxID=194707 RepID=A0AAN8VW70_9MAGN
MQERKIHTMDLWIMGSRRLQFYDSLRKWWPLCPQPSRPSLNIDGLVKESTVVVKEVITRPLGSNSRPATAVFSVPSSDLTLTERAGAAHVSCQSRLGAIYSVSPEFRKSGRPLYAGASLESLAKGAVQFSRKFTVREFYDRWHSLLFDPSVSGDASSQMTNFERSPAYLSRKSDGLTNSMEEACIPAKRKVERVRRCYNAMRKKLCSEALTSQNLNCLVATGDIDCIGNGDSLTAADAINKDSISNHFGFRESNFDISQHDFPQIANDGAVVSNGNEIANAFNQRGKNPQVEALPVNENDVPNELPAYNLFEMVHMEENPLREFDSQVFQSPISGCGTSFHNLDYSSELLGLPAWNTINSLPAPGLQVEDQQRGDAFALPGDVHATDTDTSKYDVMYSDSDMKNQMPHGELQSSTSPDGYFTGIPSSLFDFENGEEFLLEDVDGKDVIGQSYYDGLSSLLSDSPNDPNQVQIADTTDPKVSLTSKAYVASPDAVCLEGDGGLQHCDQGISSCLKAHLQSSTLVSKPNNPEMCNGVICCVLNTEDMEIPDNDAIILPNERHLQSLSAVTVSGKANRDASNPISHSIKDFSEDERSAEKEQSLMSREKIHPGGPQLSSQTKKPHLPKMVQNHTVRDSGNKHEFPKSDSIDVALGHVDTTSGGSRQNNLANLGTESVPAAVKQERMDLEVFNAVNPFLEKPPPSSEHLKSYQKDIGTSIMTQDYQALNTELGSLDTSIPGVVNPSASDQEELSEIDDDIPYFSDVEAMVLDMELGPDDHNLIYREVSHYQQEEAKRAIVRLEQGAHTCIQRTVAAHGAFAILYGRQSKHYINKPEVFFGRATEDNNVDIDLGKEGGANKISRRQGIIKLENDGCFYLKNLGKSSVLVNSKELAPGQRLRLNSGCFVEDVVRGLSFVFETNQTCVKQYLDELAKLRISKEKVRMVAEIWPV